MLRNLGIRWQILSALTLPVLILALVAGQATYASYRDMRQANEALDLSSAAASFTRLVNGLSGERLLTVAAMAGSPEAKAQLKTVRGQIDVGVKQLRALIYRTDDQPYNDEERQVLEEVSAGHDTIPAIRKLADSGKATPDQIAERYDEIIERDLRVPGDVGAILDDNTVQRNFARFSDLGYAIEGLSHEQLVGLDITFSRRTTVEQQQALGAAHAEAAGWLAEFNRTALPEQKQFLTTAMAKVAAQDKAYDAMLARFSAAGTRRASGVDGQAWTAVTQARIQALSSVLDKVARDGTGIAQGAYDDARRSAQLTAGGALAAVLLMIVVALALSRRISRPLRRLTVAATQVRDELPQIVAQVQADDTVDISLPTVESGGRNEVERLAAAFTDVNAVTLRIAREQAILRSAVAGMFVNVARRNQTLLSRQLSFIDHLERTEENPDSLENLFRLDHLAARMRRNAESLLVLAGVESGRRLRNAMPLSDVVRTAISEIEHYDRVSLVFQADPPVYPHLALPTAHLLAELLENATNFSDPGSEVVVSTAGHTDGVRLTITDAGLGMTDEELEEANARIAEPPASEGIGSQRLGFFVVGRLAQRLEAGVTLRGGRARGTVVTVDLPASLFESGSLAGLAPATTAPEALAAPTPAPALTGAPAALTSAPAVPTQTPAPIAQPSAPAVPGGLPRRGAAPGAEAAAPSAGTVAPGVPSPALPLPSPQPEAPAPASEAWSPTVPDAWAPLPGTAEPAYRPETPAAPSAPPAEPEAPVASAATPYAPPAPEMTPAQPAEPAVPSGGSEAPEAARPGLFSGFRSRRESHAEQAPPVPALPPADVPEAPEVPSPWSPVAYEPSTPAAPAVPATPADLAGPAPAAAPAEAPVVPPAEPYHPPLPAGLAGAVWSPPAPAARTQEPAGAEGAYPLRRTPSAVPLEPAPQATPAAWSPLVAEPVAEPAAEPLAAEPLAEPADADTDATETAAAPRMTGTGPMDVLPARRGRPALLRTRKPAPLTPARPAADEPAVAADVPAPPVPAQQEPRVTATPLSAEAAAEWAALADSPAGAAPIVTAPPPAAPEPRGSSPAPVGAPRSSIASEALTELSRLSSYSPASVQDEGRPTLRRRTPAPPAEPEPLPELGESGQRARTAANVRSMLAGFKAGVERGRTSPSAHRPAPRVSETSVPAQRHVGEDGHA